MAGRASVEDDKCSGRPSTSKTAENVENIGELIHEDRRRTIHEFADTAGISYGAYQEILTENLNVCHTAAKFVLQFLMSDQKQRHINACLELQEKANEGPTFISRIIMGVKSCIYRYDPETKQQLLQWKSPQSPTAKKAL
jgi:hypothetical protein